MAIYSPDEWKPMYIILQLIANQVILFWIELDVELVLCDLDEHTLHCSFNIGNAAESISLLLLYRLCSCFLLLDET